MKSQNLRLYFIDAIRAWAILMMLQGHFIDGLLDPVYRDDTNIIYLTWKFFRGITAPVFFTVSGFIFMYLLVKENKAVNIKNPRVRKGIRRGLMLIGIGYLLRLNIFGLFGGYINSSFYLVDVLHCIGLSILFLIGIYYYSSHRKSYTLPLILGIVGIFSFLFEPVYAKLSYSYFPEFIANYFTKTNGSVFTIFPWFGYASLGAFMAILFNRYKNVSHLYAKAIFLTLSIGTILTFFSSRILLYFFQLTQIQIFADVFNNNYLFIRFGNVLMLFAIFMLLRNIISSKLILNIGKSTLYIYVIHFIILYGSFTGFGLYRYLHHSINPFYTIGGAIIFLITVTYLSLLYGKNKVFIINTLKSFGLDMYHKANQKYFDLKPQITKILKRLGLSKN
ncbi:DUF1624 domain-containing protein [Flavobacteriaceae bacterium R38]|nr:DUF1624 domain-containing protein [Flavobacteriaceae bacterium R38]